MGFRYKTRNKKTALYEQHRIIAARHEYLRKILTFRSEGRPLVYLDETWLNAHHTREHCWIGYDKGSLRVPSRKGGRLIILHAGWKLVSRSQPLPLLTSLAGRGSGKVPLMSWFCRPQHSMGHKDITMIC